MNKVDQLIKQFTTTPMPKQNFYLLSFCHKHCIWTEGKCLRCISNEGPHLRTSSEVIHNSDEWKAYGKLGWLK